MSWRILPHHDVVSWREKTILENGKRSGCMVEYDQVALLSPSLNHWQLTVCPITARGSSGNPAISIACAPRYGPRMTCSKRDPGPPSITIRASIAPTKQGSGGVLARAMSLASFLHWYRQFGWLFYDDAIERAEIAWWPGGKGAPGQWRSHIWPPRSRPKSTYCSTMMPGMHVEYSRGHCRLQQHVINFLKDSQSNVAVVKSTRCMIKEVVH